MVFVWFNVKIDISYFVWNVAALILMIFSVYVALIHVNVF